jgi:hypothetical protein
MTESEWLTCDCPYDMISYLYRKLPEEDFMRFSVACCRRIWPLITDTRSRAVVEVTERYLNRAVPAAEAAGQVCAEWVRAYEQGDIHDLAGGSTNEAIESVYGLGDGHALQVSHACFQSVGYAASEAVRKTGVSANEATAAWQHAEKAEKSAQCQLIRDLFAYRS